MHKSTTLLLSAAQALWSAYCFPGLAGLRLCLFVCLSLPLCCFLRHKWTGMPLRRQRMVSLQVMHKSTSLLLSTAQALWNAYCFSWPKVVSKKKQICLAVAFSGTNALEYLIQTCVDLEWFLSNNCTYQPHCCFYRHKCTGMPNRKLWLP